MHITHTRPSDRLRKKAMTGHQWQLMVIGEIWDHRRLVLWTLRKQDLHSVTISQKVRAEHRDIQCNLWDLCL